MAIEKGHTMKIRQLVIRSLCLLGLWLGLGLQAYAATDTVTYVYTDPQGTPLVEADASGNVIARYDYTPYGNAVASLGSPPDGPGYTGHVNDPETGLVYMQARYYQPIGRFMSPDPVGPSVGNIFSFNRYTYANNNAVANIDPTGACVGSHNGDDEPCDPKPTPIPPSPSVSPAVQRMRDTSDSGRVQAPITAYQQAAAAAVAQSMLNYIVTTITSWNGSLGIGVTGSFMPDQGGVDAGVAGDTSGKMCFYVTKCGGATVTKPPVWASYGGVGTVGHGMLPAGRSVTTYGAIYYGGETIMGDGGLMRDREGSYSTSRGFLGEVFSPYGNVVYGGGGQMCNTTYYGCSK